MLGGFGGVPRKPDGQAESPKLGIVNGIPGQTQGRAGPRLGIDTTAFSRKVVVSDTPEVRHAEVFWEGFISGVSGYAKANREILSRVSNSIKVRFHQDPSATMSEQNMGIREVLERYQKVGVTSSAPKVTFSVPRVEVDQRFRVIYTMMETEVVHPDMIKVMNENYNECWVPTRWNAQTFVRSGLKIPVYIMPLGVDPAVYCPGPTGKMVPATRLTGPNAGQAEVPSGFLFIYVFQPTFRKGLDALVKAFEEAFAYDQGAGLVLGTTAYPIDNLTRLLPENMRSRVWALTGSYSEIDLAAIYRACHVYVCTSRGEGWNLPLVEAASTGLPVIVPNTSVHPEMVPPGCGYFFNSDGMKLYQESCQYYQWFSGIHFPEYGSSSQKQLADIMKSVKGDYASALRIGKRYMDIVRSRFTWEAAAKNVADRIRTLCGK